MADNDNNIQAQPFYGNHDPETLTALDFDDRRRLLVEEVLFMIERDKAMPHPFQMGQAVLRNVVDINEVEPISTKADKSLVSKLMQRGML